MRITKEQKGITLIALVITIIVLLILAGVAISQLTGGNILDNAQTAVDRYNDKAGQEDDLITQLDELLSQYAGESQGGGNPPTPTLTPTPTPTPTQKTAADLQEGDWVLYDTGVSTVGTDGVIPCRVLYNDQTHGIQLISAGTVGDNVTLGVQDDFNASKTSYTNAISTLNTAAGTYLNTTYAYDARCVGSVPTVGANGTFNAKDSEVAGPVTLPFEHNGSNQIDVPNIDTNYETDWTQMGSLGSSNANIQVGNGPYWLASRNVEFITDACTFYLRLVGGNTIYGGGICGVNIRSDGEFGFATSCGLRPCFSLKPNIKVITEGGKDGTEESKAYTLAP